MSRFLGLLLMLCTGAVIVELVAKARLSSAGTGMTLLLAFIFLGLLVGFLATARQMLWAALGCAIAVVPLWFSGEVPLPPPDGDWPRTMLLYLVPPLGLVLGSWLGLRHIERQLRARIKPEHEG